MKLTIMSFIGSFMPQQVSISTSLEILLVAFSAFFSNGKGYSAIRILFLDTANNMTHSSICEIFVLSTLEYKGAKAQSVAFLTAGKNFFLRKAIAFSQLVASADTAIIAVIFAVVGKFNKSPNKNSLTINLLPYCCRPLP